MMATMEAGMNAVERQKFYIDNVEREDDTTMLSTTRLAHILSRNTPAHST